MLTWLPGKRRAGRAREIASYSPPLACKGTKLSRRGGMVDATDLKNPKRVRTLQLQARNGVANSVLRPKTLPRCAKQVCKIRVCKTRLLA